MSKINLDNTVTNNSSTTLPYNENFRLIEAEFQDKVLYRTNPTGEPNQMNNDLDMNSHHIYNVSGFILKSPNGTQYIVSVSDSGTIVTTPI